MSMRRSEHIALGEHLPRSFGRWWTVRHVVVDASQAWCGRDLSVGGWACKDTRLAGVDVE